MSRIVIVLAVLGIAAGALAQADPPPPSPDLPPLPDAPPRPAQQQMPPQRPPLRISAAMFGQYTFDTDIDGGGNFDVSRFATAVGLEYDFRPDLTLLFRTTYELSLYDFSDATGLGDPDPWDDVNSLTLDTRLQWAVRRDWIVFGGPLFRFANESGAPMEDGFTAGGTIGFSHVFSRAFILGGGLIISSDIEDDLRVLPLIVFDWRINEQWRLRSTPGPRNIGGAGMELSWQPAKDWSFGVGGRYESRRFRLDESGVAPLGVGEETNVSFWLRATWDVTDHASLNLYAGFVTFGQLELHDENGVRIGEQDFDPTPSISLSGRVEF